MNYIDHIYTADSKSNISLYIGIMSVLLLMLSGCIFSYKEPSKNPSITYISISNKAVITDRDVTIIWEGNSYAANYQYTFDDIESEITDKNSVTLTDLDDGNHLFILRAYDDSLKLKSSPLLINFTVDAITGPGVLLFPRKITEQTSLSISLVDVDDIMAVHIEFDCENKCASFGAFVPKTIPSNSGEMIVLTDNSDQDRYIIDIAFAGITEGISGSVYNLGTLYINPLRIGSITIDSSKTIFRNTANETITLNDLDFVRVIK
ncbi:MAG: hypothetical protein JXB48_16970 [Candidatus Latescibacteria bacterium]|nr:hypothetical protein [Candidatus Latescibacterota bacterium]